MPTSALTPPPAAPDTIFSALSRNRIAINPWVAFTFEQADAVLEADGCIAAGTLDAIAALGYEVGGSFIPWT